MLYHGNKSIKISIHLISVRLILMQRITRTKQIRKRLQLVIHLLRKINNAYSADMLTFILRLANRFRYMDCFTLIA